MPDKGKVSFPLSKALAFSARSVRLRLGRMVIVVMGIASAMAFVTVLLSLRLVMSGMAGNDEPAGGLEQFWLWWLIVAGLIALAGITNAILMSVTERIKEIGTIRCLGAMSRHVVMIFLFESLFLGLVGGAIGGVTGVLFTLGYSVVYYGMGALEGVSWLTLMLIALLGTGGSMVLCVISAIYPVLFAAKLQPADAMRYEV